MEQRWFTLGTEYDGLPLFLRKPEYKNIFAHRDKFPRVLCVTHKLDKVKKNGLPESKYNASLIEFDGQMTDLFDKKNEGLIFLVETFGGERNYYYFVSDSVDFKKKIKLIKKNNADVELKIDSYMDEDWDFLKNYPSKLY